MKSLSKDDEAIKKAVKDAEDSLADQDEDFDWIAGKVPIRMESTLSTGSTLLDLAISGKRKRGGGIPGGIMAEIYGPSSTGKTQLAGEICAEAQAKGGQAKIGDAEGKFDVDYALKYGYEAADNIFFPDTPHDLFKEIMTHQPTGNGVIDVLAADSIAALISSADLPDSEFGKKGKKKEDAPEIILVGDKMGGLKPKEIHALCRKSARYINKTNLLVIFTNHLLDSMKTYGSGKFVPGGNAIPYYSTLRISLTRIIDIVDKVIIPRERVNSKGDKVITNVPVEKIIGVEVLAECTKNHVDEPFRSANIRILFRHGIDDIGTNLQWYKEMMAEPTYDAFSKKFQSLDDAIHHIEDNDLEEQLRERTINLWQEIENKFSTRKPKKRGR